MRRGFVAFFALSLVGVGLTGCGLFRFEQREPWRAQAEEACLAQRLVQPSAYMALSSKIDGPGVCGMDHPFKVAAFNGGSIGLKSKVTLACPIIPRIDTWLDEIVKPAAMMYFGVPVARRQSGFLFVPAPQQSAGRQSLGTRLRQCPGRDGVHPGRRAGDHGGQGLEGRPGRTGIPPRGLRRRLPVFHHRARTGSDSFHHDHLHLTSPGTIPAATGGYASRSSSSNRESTRPEPAWLPLRRPRPNRPNRPGDDVERRGHRGAASMSAAVARATRGSGFAADLPGVTLVGFARLAAPRPAFELGRPLAQT